MSLKNKVDAGVVNLKTYWNKPPKGYDLSYKEFLFFNIGSSSMGLAQPLVIYTAIAAGTPFLAKYFGISNGAVLLLSWIGMIIALIRAPILSMIIDNHNSPKGKFLPFLSWSLIAAVICFGLIPFLPASWVNINLLSIPIPDIPWLRIAATDVHISLGLLIVFIVVQLGTTFHQIYVQAITGVEQTITTVSQERTNIASFKGLIANIPGSILGAILPVAAMLFFGSKVGGQGIDDVRMFRIFFPVSAILAIVAVSFMIKGVKERVVIEKQHVSKVKFSDGAKELSKNKYFWIIQIVAIAVGMRAIANVQMIYWTCTYSIGGSEGELVFSICNILLNNAFIPAMILSPFFVKKIGKKNLIILSSSLFIVVLGIQTAFADQPYLILTCIFFQNFCNGLQLVMPVMTSDALDYQQFKTGKRMEGFWHNYGIIIMTISGFFTSLLPGFFQSLGGLDFGTTPDIAFQDTGVMIGVFRYTALLALIGAVVALIPMFFYDLTEVKHKNIIGILKMRATVRNYESNKISDQDIVDLNELINISDFKKNEDYENEYEQCREILEEVLLGYESAKTNVDLLEEQEIKLNLDRKIEMEQSQLVASIEKEKKNLAKKGINFDEELFTKNFIDNSKYLKDIKTDDILVEDKENSIIDENNNIESDSIDDK